MDKIDSSAYKLTLASLESENMKLSFDSRAIIANAGTFTVSRETLDQLSTPIALQTDDDLKFWESVCNDYSSIVSKIPDLLISRIRSGIPSELRTKIWILMCDAKPDRIALLYPGLLNDESQFGINKLTKIV